MSIAKNQTNLYRLGKNKDIVIKALQNNEDIISLILPNYNPDTSTVDADVLLEDHLFDTIEIDNTQLEAKVYICVETYVPEVESNTIKTIGLVINVFAHSSLRRLSGSEKAKFYNRGYSGNRVDVILDVIDRYLNGKRDLGIGKMRLKPRSPIGIFQPKNGFYGKSIEYIVSDFNDIPLC